jgi:apolipoprotein N-acyltransferase
VTATTPGTATVVITTTAGIGPISRDQRTAPPGLFDVRVISLLALLASMLIFIARRRSFAQFAWARRLAPAILVVVLAVFASACINNGTPGTPRGAHVITVQATSGNITHTAQVTLVVR